jgi:hypothetical protein
VKNEPVKGRKAKFAAAAASAVVMAAAVAATVSATPRTSIQAAVYGCCYSDFECQVNGYTWCVNNGNCSSLGWNGACS